MLSRPESDQRRIHLKYSVFQKNFCSRAESTQNAGVSQGLVNDVEGSVPQGHYHVDHTMFLLVASCSTPSAMAPSYSPDSAPTAKTAPFLPISILARTALPAEPVLAVCAACGLAFFCIA
jgi:hypothetical protein